MLAAPRTRASRGGGFRREAGTARHASAPPRDRLPSPADPRPATVGL